MSQPRGGPMFTGHATIQVGLDADIWLTPMPDHRLSRNDREEMSAVMMVREDRLDIDPRVFTPGHLMVIRAAAQEPAVQRIFVNAAIKKALCRDARATAAGSSKVRRCTATTIISTSASNARRAAESNGQGQPDPSTSEGCSAGDLAYWFKDSVIHPKPPKVPPKPKPPMPMSALPAACKSGADRTRCEA